MSRPRSSAAAERPVRVDFRNRGADSALVFIHGFGGHAEETWGDFPRFIMEREQVAEWDVFGIGYSTSLRIDLARAWSADARLDTLGYYLRTTLALPPLDRYKRIALVAHSMGGLIAQQALLDERFSARISHVMLFGTPSGGVNRAGPLQSLKQQARDMSVGSEFIANLRSAWTKAYGDRTPFALRAIAGERDTFIPTVSSLEPFPDAVRYVVPGDHLTMVTPRDARALCVDLVVQTLTCEARAVSLPAKTNLPRNLSRFIGREKEISEIRALMESTQLLTIVGPGGIGKTRTTLEAATGLGDAAPDGVWFVDLAPLTDPALVPSAIAAALSIEDKGSSQALIDTIAVTLREKNALIVLDNCEHVVLAAAGAADRILRACAGIRMIVTSREPLAIAGETTFRMPTLSIAEGVALFADRAKAADSTFHLTDGTKATVEEIVRRLDGIALAIELAAPRVKVLGIDQLSKRLDQRLKLLAGGNRTALPRQQTLRALIGWSYDLLNEEERALLRQLSIFRGSFTIEAAGEICEPPSHMENEWDALLLISSLIDKSLVVTESNDEDVRYRLLESTREYAFERLTEAGESDAAAMRHCRCFADAAARAYESVWTTNLEEWLSQVRADLENYRAAIDWGLLGGHDVTRGASIVADLLHLWEQALSGEGFRLLECAERTVDERTPQLLQGRLLLMASLFKGRSSPELETCARAVDTLSAAGDRISYADALRVYGRACIRLGRIDEAVCATEKALEIARTLQRPRLTARILTSLGVWHLYNGQREAGLSAVAEAASILRRVNDRRRIIITIANMAEMKFGCGDVPGAIEDASEGLAIAGEMDAELEETSLTRANLAAYLLEANDLAEAWLQAREALESGLRLQAHRTIIFALQHLAHIAVLQGQFELAARIIGHVDAYFTRQSMTREATEDIGYRRMMAILHAGLGEAAASALMEQGAAAQESSVVEEALTIPQPERTRAAAT